MGIKILGSSSGSTTITAPASGGDETIELSTALAAKVSSKILQVVQGTSAAFLTTTANIPLDDTIPQISEGTQFLTATITPVAVSSSLLVEVVMHTANDNAASLNLISIFRDSGVNALSSAWARSPAANTPPAPIVVKVLVSAGSVSATTFTVRGGTAGAATTFQMNGASGARYFGGALISSITITEIAA
jgi:hypothetical protein